jgi:hypothetical protein
MDIQNYSAFPAFPLSNAFDAAFDTALVSQNFNAARLPRFDEPDTSPEVTQTSLDQNSIVPEILPLPITPPSVSHDDTLIVASMVSLNMAHAATTALSNKALTKSGDVDITRRQGVSLPHLVALARELEKSATLHQEAADKIGAILHVDYNFGLQFQKDPLYPQARAVIENTHTQFLDMKKVHMKISAMDRELASETRQRIDIIAAGLQANLSKKT